MQLEYVLGGFSLNNWDRNFKRVNAFVCLKRSGGYVRMLVCVTRGIRFAIVCG